MVPVKIRTCRAECLAEPSRSLRPSVQYYHWSAPRRITEDRKGKESAAELQSVSVESSLRVLLLIKQKWEFTGHS